jgi:hypothetical protein
MLGAIIIFKYGNTAIGDEEALLTLETIASHIAPVLSNLKEMSYLSQHLVTNYEACFKRDLKKEIEEALQYDLDLMVIQFINKETKLFIDEIRISHFRKSFKKVYPFANNSTFIIWNGNEKELVKKLSRLTQLKGVDIRVWMLNRDFKNYEDFVSLF